ncbi:PQQ-binding-like beta-propeller repeat protein [Pseudorhodoplanes sp.]|uniref:outer membrane protein assembly factor BamB family protein n=1 Tax=Pseudorhodoplanes sp. TaxID=1934341 RepID=UPI002BB56C7E|nr:PQQ-binding-like beta-propeller repeat protein [Pseudorhodoplanes sp.]HWV54710.1 PQQ-binding-like beta-propeller repeat protein [Pseudorhodoplanes sp.]
MKFPILSGPVIATLALASFAHAQNAGWSHFNGDLSAQKFSPLSEITPANVKNLRTAWRMRTAETPAPGGWQATPIFANDTLYVGTPRSRILALEPDSGRLKWSYDPKPALDAAAQRGASNRGVAYWQADKPIAEEPCQKRVYVGTVDAKLHAVDADSGKLCADFGDAGVLNADQWNSANRKWPLALTQPPTVFRDFLFLGWSGNGLAEGAVSPGTLFALDARSGALRWTFESIPEEVAGKTGMANVAGSMTVDPVRNMLYIPVRSPSPDFFGGNRLDDIPYANSVTALDIPSGKVVWSRQLVHHDVWDYGPNAAPSLVDIVKDGNTIPALVQTSKQGFLFVLNRETGEPIYPIEERPAPRSTVPGEVAAPTQPFATMPPPATGDTWPGIFKLADWVSFGYCTRIAAGRHDEGRFTPPSLQGSLTYPSLTGAIGSGGGAIDPRSQTMIVNATSAVQIYRLLRRADYNNLADDDAETARGLYPMRGTPYGARISTFLNPLRMPCWNPPFGTLSSYDLKSGKLLWRKPFGQVQRWGFYMPEAWGTPTVGGPAITASGLIFIGGSMDSRVRAIDLKTGDVLWKHLVPAPSAALPAIYSYKGKQYVVFAAGGHPALTSKISDAVVAFALP